MKTLLTICILLVTLISAASDSSVELIKKYEGFRSQIYLCSAKKETIGYGETDRKMINYYRGKILSEERATLLLKLRVKQVERDMLKLVRTDLTENQKTALLSLVYNIGITNFRKSTLLKKLNSNDFSGAADQFLLWRNANGKVLPGLEKRRNQEKEIFEKK